MGGQERATVMRLSIQRPAMGDVVVLWLFVCSSSSLLWVGGLGFDMAQR